MHRARRAADGSTRAHAQPMPRHAGTGEDVGVVHAIAIAIERPVVHHDAAVARIGVGAARGVEHESQVTRVPLEVVPDERVAAGERGEHPRDPGPADAVAGEDRIAHASRIRPLHARVGLNPVLGGTWTVLPAMRLSETRVALTPARQGPVTVLSAMTR